MIYTYQHTIEGCPRRDRRTWQEFVKANLPLGRTLLAHYFPELAPDAVRQLFAATADNDFAFFRQFKGTSEREFLIAFRALAIEFGRVARSASPDPGVPDVSAEVLEAALQDFTAVQLQIVWFWALGYSVEQICAFLTLTEPTVEQTLERANEQLRAGMDQWSALSLRASVHNLASAFAVRETPDCYSYRLFQRLLDGQASWRDREAILTHVTRCYRCLERSTSLLEVVHYGRTLPKASDAEVEQVLASLPFALTQAKRSLASRLFGQ